MENEAFEMNGDKIPAFSSTKEAIPERPRRNLLRIFLLCFLASILSTSLGALALSLACREISRDLPASSGSDVGEKEDTTTELKYDFLFRLGSAKIHKFPGGEIRWARFWRESRDDDGVEGRSFGLSLKRRRSRCSAAALRLRPRALRVPHWHLNANEHGYLVKGQAWIGVIGADGSTAVTYNVSQGQVVFFPQNSVHWVKNVGSDDLLFLLFFSTHDELLTLDVDDVFYGTPEDVAARALKPVGGVQFIRTFRKPEEDQAISLPKNLDQLIHNSSYPQSPDSQVWKYFYDLPDFSLPKNLDQLIHNSSYPQSPDSQVWKYFYDLPASQEFPFPGGIFKWARFRKNGTGLTENEQIFSQSLHEQENSLTLGTVKIFSNGSGAPHLHLNGNEMGTVLSGCGQVGLVLPEGNSQFSIGIGDVVFFPQGSQHFLQSFCQEDLTLLLAYTTSNQLQTLRMNQYFQGTADHILAQVFSKDQREFQKIPKNSS